jgi:hypothetical protein
MKKIRKKGEKPRSAVRCFVWTWKPGGRLCRTLGSFAGKLAHRIEGKAPECLVLVQTLHTRTHIAGHYGCTTTAWTGQGDSMSAISDVKSET